jgi:hypothetical protein
MGQRAKTFIPELRIGHPFLFALVAAVPNLLYVMVHLLRVLEPLQMIADDRDS